MLRSCSGPPGEAMVPVVLGLVLGTLDRFFHWQLRRRRLVLGAEHVSEGFRMVIEQRRLEGIWSIKSLAI